MIKLNNISKIFSSGKDSVYALKNINLHVPAGQIFGIIGKSGAGKSTLIRCVNLLEQPTSGQVFIDGVDITHLSNRQLIDTRHKVSMIFQHFNLLSAKNVFDNIAFPLELKRVSKKKIAEKVNSLLSLVGLSDKANAYPSHLSGGQKQRVAIARALANDPKVLLCDEATSALDPESTRSVLNLLKEINQKLNLTILLITHEMEVVKQICHQVAVISHGELVEQASVSDMFSNPKSDAGKQFIKSTLHLPVPKSYQEKLSDAQTDNKNPLLRINFTGVLVDNPILSRITKMFDIETNIISAQMDYAGDVKFGVMLAEIIGNNADTQKAIHFLQENNIKVEIIGYV